MTAHATRQQPPAPTAQAHGFYPDGWIPSGQGVWVFASDTSGQHNHADAKIAQRHFGAQIGHSAGATGDAFAILMLNDKRKALPMVDIQWQIHAFLRHASNTPQTPYYIARLAAGIAGLSDRRIAPLFKSAPANCHFPQAWSQWMQAPNGGRPAGNDTAEI